LTLLAMAVVSSLRHNYQQYPQFFERGKNLIQNGTKLSMHLGEANRQ